MIVHLNGQERELSDGATVRAALELLELPPDARGIAVAVEGEVVPRGEWDATVLTAGARVEVLTAVQGG